ncbi:MAG: ATP-dependent DNA helicase [Acidimicrobiia bacterium]
MTFIPTAEQRAIISHPLEPLRVSAGAGTGKTTTVSHRIAHFISQHGFEPEQVLGVTFTNKAAEELADRVRQVVGADLEPSRQVEIHTYHGFAAQILREFGALVGVERTTSVVTPTFTRQMLSAIVRSVPLPTLNATWPGTVDRIRKLAGALGDHLRHPDSIVLPDELSGPWLERSDLLAAVRIYTAEKQRLGVADYGDLISSAHRVVSDHPWVAERVRSRYRAVVLDEYQDTNPGQRLLLSAVFGGGFPVTAVGDADQTIYEWRGASIGNFRRFPVHFATAAGTPAPTLPLSENRRSGTTILSVANAIRARVDDEARDLLRATEDAPSGQVRVGWFDDAVVEAEWIADEILRSHENGTPWRDTAVLFRKNKDMAVVRDALASLDIPTEVANLGGLLSVPEVVELHSWLRLLNAPDDGPALARILMGSRHRLGMSDLAVLGRWVHRTHAGSGDPEGDDRDDVSHSLLEAIDHVDDLDGLRPEAKRALDTFARRYRALLIAAQGSSLVELCRRILDTTGSWRDVEAMSDARRLSARLNLYRFLDLAEQWSPLEGRPALDSFLDYLWTMDSEPAEELDTARLAGADAVTLLTVHRAKGLEWPVVFLPGAYRGNFPSAVVGAFDNPFTKAESLPYDYRLDAEDLPPIDATMSESQVKDLLRQRHESQEWRIAYVAATRAKRCLTVTGAHWYGYPEPTKKPAVPSSLFELVARHPGTEVVSESAEAPERPVTVGFRTDRAPAPDPVFGAGGWQRALRQAIAGASGAAELAGDLGVSDAYHAAVADYHQLLFRIPEPTPPPAVSGVVTSVSGLVNYAGCPKRYYWSEVDRLPRRHSPAARRGVDVHRRIELHHKGIVPLDEAQPGLYDLTPVDMAGTPAVESADAFATFADSRFATERPYLVEAAFELRLASDVTVRGRIDAVYRTGGRWEVVDFKSGRPNPDPSLGVQLQAYALAVDQQAFTSDRPEQLTVTFAYLGDGLVEHSETVDETWLDDARTRLETLATDIRSERFDPQPSAGCRRCDFITFCPAGRAFDLAH